VVEERGMRGEREGLVAKEKEKEGIVLEEGQGVLVGKSVC
jgi:hypothetical protein